MAFIESHEYKGEAIEMTLTCKELSLSLKKSRYLLKVIS